QCDIDVIGKDKLDPAYDAELPAIIVRIFEELRVGKFTIHFSNRKVLLGLLAAHGIEDAEKQKLVLREIDKFDKVGTDKVRASLGELGLEAGLADTLLRLISHQGGKEEALADLRAQKAEHPLFLQGLAEVAQMIDALKALGVPDERTRFNLKIARGLDYYTGTVYETLIDDHPEFGSVCSGGRYDDLASFYTKSKLPGVGLSIGLTRLFDQLRASNLLPLMPGSVQVLVAQLDPQLGAAYLSLAAELRHAGFNVENYLEPAKLDKQLKYADKAGIPFVVLLGPDEKAKGTVLVKDFAAKQQYEVTHAGLIEKLRILLK
ncbi:MAG: histidine--tRNA ligase, partial [Bdellovibrionales bacterium]